jgi:hypothetical protein
MHAAARANALRGLRPMVSRFQPSTLPKVARSFSASARRSYEYIEVTEPRPGVGQSKQHTNTTAPSRHPLPPQRPATDTCQ